MEDNIHNFLFFKLGDERFAIDVSYIIEVLELHKITEIPQSQDFIKGVTNFRGEILPVIDSHKKLNIDKTDDKTIVIIMNIEENGKKTLIGITANSVNNVNQVFDNEISSIPDSSLSINRDYLSGMIKQDKYIIFILNVNKAFSPTELAGNSD